MTSTQPIVVAVYGSLKRGFYNHHLLERSRFLATGTVHGLVMHSLGSYPMVVKGRGSIHVELFEVDAATFAALDRLEGFPSFYGREVVTVQTDYCPVEAWLYLGQPYQVKGQRRVASGDWQQESGWALRRRAAH